MEKLRNVARFGKYGKRLCMMFLFLCITTSGLMRASVFAQTTVTAKFRNVTLNEVLWEIQKQTDFTFIYSTNDAKKVRVENLDVKNELISEVLNKCLRNSGLTYTVHDGVIAIRKAEPVRTETVAREKYTITGKVIEDSGEPIIGANVIVKGTTNGMMTDMDGNFHLEVTDKKVTLMVSYIGYIRQEIKVTSAKTIKVEMTPDNNLMDEVVITGYGTFKKSAYAGSAASVKGELYYYRKEDYPALADGIHTVKGQLFYVKNLDKVLQPLDVIEGYIAPNHPENMYDRKILDVKTASGEIKKAYAYVINPRLIELEPNEFSLMETRCWKTFKG